MKKNFLKIASATLAVSVTAGGAAALVKTNNQEVPTAAAATEEVLQSFESGAYAFAGGVYANGYLTVDNKTEGSNAVYVTAPAQWFELHISLNGADLSQYTSLKFDFYSPVAFNVAAPNAANYPAGAVTHTLTKAEAEAATVNGKLTFVMMSEAGKTFTVDNVRGVAADGTETVINGFETPMPLGGVTGVGLTCYSASGVTNGAFSAGLEASSEWFEVYVPVSISDLSKYSSMSFDYSMTGGAAMSSPINDIANVKESGTYTVDMTQVVYQDGYVVMVFFGTKGSTLYIDNFRFTANEYALTVTAGTGGSVTGGGTYVHGTEVTLTATPSAGYKFVKWSDGNTNATRTVTVKAAATYTAEFAKNEHKLTVTAGDGGTVTGGGTYTNGKEVTIKATPSTGYKFVKWSDGNTSAERKVTVSADATYTATFEKLKYTLTVSAGEGGSVTGGGTYEHGSEATLTATPNAGYTFTQWSDGNKEATRTVTVTAAATYTATFTINKYTVTATAETGGTAKVSASTVNHGDSVTLTATPNTGYNFAGWYNGEMKVSDNAEYTVGLVTSNLSYTAKFTIKSYIIAVEAGEGGKVAGGGSYTHGATATLVATPDVGYEFVKWSDGDTNATRTVSATAAATYKATFKKIDCTVTLTSGMGGSVSGAGSYQYGDAVTITATPEKGYSFKEWSDGNKEATRTLTVTEAISLSATFTLNTYQLTLTAGEGGKVVGAGEYNYNETATITATPNTGYSFVKWSDGNTSATREVKITDNLALTATFQINSYSVSATAEKGGEASVNASKVNYGGSATFAATAQTGYTFDGWYNGASKVSSLATYTATVTGNLTLTAKFTINSYDVTVSVDGQGGTVSGSATVEYGSKATVTAMTSIGYTFVGWYVNGEEVSTQEEYTFSVGGDVTLVAKWTRIQYTHTFMTVDNTLYESKTTDASTSTDADLTVSTFLPTMAPEKSGYTFIGWVESVSGERITESTMICNDGNKTYYPVYLRAYQNSITTTATITMNFYVEYLSFLTDKDVAFSLRFVETNGETVDQNSADVETRVVDGAYCYRFTFAQAPKDYTNRLRVSLYVGEETFSLVNAKGETPWRNYSIDTYLTDVKAAASELAAAGDTATAEKYTNFAVDTKLFCEMARQYFSASFTEPVQGKADAEAFEKLSTLTADTIGKQMNKVVGENNTAIRPVGCTLVLNLGTELRFNFQVRDGEGYATELPSTYTIMVDGVEATATKRTTESYNGTTYFYVSITNIAAKDLGASHEIVITDTTTGEALTVSVSPMAYIYEAVSTYEAAVVKGTATSEQTKLAYLMKAMYYYYQSAAAYFA